MQCFLAVSNVPKAVGQFRGRVVTNDNLFAKKFGSVICNQTAIQRQPVRRESGRSQHRARHAQLRLGRTTASDGADLTVATLQRYAPT